MAFEKNRELSEIVWGRGLEQTSKSTKASEHYIFLKFSEKGENKKRGFS
jgi:hypothetical protein